MESLSKAADSIGDHVLEPVADAVSGGVSTLTDGVTSLLPTRGHRRRQVVVYVIVGLLTLGVVVAVARGRADRRARRTQDELAVDLAERADERGAPDSEAGDDRSDGDGVAKAERDSVHAAD